MIKSDNIKMDSIMNEVIVDNAIYKIFDASLPDKTKWKDIEINFERECKVEQIKDYPYTPNFNFDLKKKDFEATIPDLF